MNYIVISFHLVLLRGWILITGIHIYISMQLSLTLLCRNRSYGFNGHMELSTYVFKSFLNVTFSYFSY